VRRLAVVAADGSLSGIVAADDVLRVMAGELNRLAANRRAYRDAERKRIARFAEVFVETPLETCVARDPKGLYRNGMQIAYEPPVSPELMVHGAVGAPADRAQEILALLEQRSWLGGLI
jgi:bifunctional enzyme CysN/CysC